MAAQAQIYEYTHTNYITGEFKFKVYFRYEISDQRSI